MAVEDLLRKTAERIDACARDADALAAIDAELAARPEPRARSLRIKIAGLQRAIKLAPASSTSVAIRRPETTARIKPLSPSAAGGSIWDLVLRRTGIPRPDGRPLHRYRLSDEEHDDLRRTLRARPGWANGPTARDSAASFVLWAAHWFQRDYVGGTRRWEDLSAAIGVPFDGHAGRQLVREGLEAWRRPPVKAEGDTAKLWLRTLAVEGGFPAGVLNRADTWPAIYLSRVVGMLLASDNVEDAAGIAAAEAQANHAPRAYRQDIFFALAADLSLAIVKLRREVALEERASGVPVSAWLDATRPGWRHELPVRTGTAAADQLVDGLMRAEVVRLIGGGDVTSQRILRRDDAGVWRAALRLGLDGLAKGDIVSALGRRQQRLRAYPSREFARYVSGELAIFEPPGEDDEGWRILPSRRETRVKAVPFSVPITVELRFEGTKVSEAPWPDGEAVRGEVWVFKSEIDPDGRTLVLIGTMSGAYGPDNLTVATPPDWTVLPHHTGDTVSAPDEPVEGGLRLWDVHGAAVVRAPDGDVYRVASGQRGAGRDRLLLSGSRPMGLASDESDIELFAGAPSVQVSEGAKVRSIRSDELRWRIAGEPRGWRPAPFGLGLIDLAWREPQTGYLRDRRRIFILPDGARLACRSDNATGVYTADGFPIDRLVPADVDLVAERRVEGLAVRFMQRPSRRARFLLDGGSGRSLRVSTGFPQRSGIARWSGECVPGRGNGAQGTALTIAELSDCVAFGAGPHRLRATLHDRDGRFLSGGASSWSFSDELPLRGVAEELAALLAPYADIDVVARLAFDGGAEHWSVRQFEATLALRAGRIVGITGMLKEETLPLVGRAVDDLATEVVLAQSTFADRSNMQAPVLPDGLSGTWLMYLRRGNAVIARPSIVSIGPGSHRFGAGLANAVTISDRLMREAAILDGLERLADGSEEGESDIRWLVSLAAGLDGLPPASLDVFRLLPQRSGAAARMAMHAREAEREAVIALMEALPFAWHLIPYRDWARAALIEERVLIATLEAAFGAATAQDLAKQAVRAAALKLAAYQPLLGWPLCAAGLIPPPLGQKQSLIEAARDHIRRHGDHVPDSGTQDSLFRVSSKWDLPTEFLSVFNPVHLEMLDAPCAAACAAAGQQQPAEDAIRRMKTAARVDSLYFSAAFDAHFTRLAQRHRIEA